jgi:type I restriction enzyme M protein
MAIKKSDLYSSIWASCDELRGGMDASQYKDYVLFMLFIKYITDKYGNSSDFASPVTIPKGASFKDMIALKGKSDIGDKINTQIIQPLIDANARLARSDFPDFNDPNKLGEGDAMVQRLTNLIGIFQKPELDFSQNRADHDDILGDAYEYLMRHFATESGKSKGQFYTPAEVSRVIAKVIGISPANTKASTTAYDPTCGSGSLLLKVAAQAGKHITLEGQEKDVTTAGLARMNMILHDFPTANILSGNTLAAPKFKDGEQLRTYDYVVANPPFSDKTWTTGLTQSKDPFQRFAWGEPPAKQGDYVPTAHYPLDERRGQRRLHPASWRSLPRQRRGHDPQAARSFRLPQGHHRPARKPFLRDRHPSMHRGARQGERLRPQGRLHDRRL